MSYILQKLAKFGLQYCDLETMIGNLDVMLRLLAINIDVRNKKPPFIIRVIASCLIANLFFVYIFNVVWQLLTGKSGDAVSTVLLLTLLVCDLTILVKLCFMYLNHGAVQKIVSGYLACDSNVNRQSRFGNNLYASLRIVKKRALIVWCVLIVNPTAYALIPVFKKERCFPNDSLIMYGLEPMLESPNYEIAMTLIIVAMFMIFYIPSNVGSFFIVICGYTEAYLIALSKEIEAIYNDALEYYELNNTPNKQLYSRDQKYSHDEKVAKFIEHRLVRIAKEHIIILNLTNKVQEAYQNLLVAELILLMISVIADLLAGLENTFLQMNYGLFVVGMDCFAGQRVMDASVTFEQAVYACNWENFDPKNRKIVLLMLINSQKTLNLSAGTVTMLNIETFGKIIKTIYSAYTTLQSTIHNT